MKLDIKNKKILSILDWSARTPVTQIARRVGLNKDVVRYRIKQMEEESVIKSYYPVIDVSRLGYMTVRVYFDFVDVDGEKLREIVRYLDVKFDAGQIFSRDGDYQLGIISWVKSLEEFKEKVNNLRKLYDVFIEKMQFSIFIRFNQYPMKYLSENFSKEIVLKKNDFEKIDSEDLEILKALSKNARRTTTDLSVDLKIPQRTVSYKIKNLEKKGIVLGYRALIDSNKLGYENYYLEMQIHNLGKIKEIIGHCKHHKNCLNSTEVFEGADLEIETEFTNRAELLKFIEEIKKSFKDIRKVRYASTINYYKIEYLPN